ncbi:MAG: acyl-CoA dehydrogenase family protein, partial [Mycobacterium sp.]|nr:acyl-CoA dehydrogenase family protein [Mycobacterium sp.]
SRTDGDGGHTTVRFDPIMTIGSGAGCSLLERVTAIQDMVRGLSFGACVRSIASDLAQQLLDGTGGDANAVTAGLSLDLSDGLFATDSSIQLTRSNGVPVAVGRAEHVPALIGTGGTIARRILLTATDVESGDPVLVVASTTEPGCSVHAEPVILLEGAGFGRVDLDHAPVDAATTRSLADSASRARAMASIAEARLLLAHATIDLAQRVLAATVDHVTGRAFRSGYLADLQVVRHRLVEATGRARVAAEYVRSVTEDWEPADPTGATAAAMHVATAASEIVQSCAQLFGGSGYLTDNWISSARDDIAAAGLMLGDPNRLRDCLRDKICGVRTLPAIVSHGRAADEHASAGIWEDVAPKIAQWDPDSTIPREAYRLFGRAGLTGLTVPVEYGGRGLEQWQALSVLREAMRFGLTGLCTSIGAQSAIALPLLLAHGTKQQRDTYVRGIVSGELVAGVALTEDNGGSDLVNTVQTRAEPVDSGWVINGHKAFVTNGPIADVILVLARTNRTAGALGMTLFAVPAQAPGCQRLPPLSTTVLRSSPTGRVVLQDCRVSRDALVGNVGYGLAYVSRIFDVERLMVAALAVAAARACVEQTRDCLSAEHGIDAHIAAELIDANVELAACDRFVERVVRHSAASGVVRLDPLIAKSTVVDLAQQVIRRCRRMVGTRILARAVLARLVADAAVFSVYGGTSETVRDAAAALILSGATRSLEPSDG